jgi:hypothetical protein
MPASGVAAFLDTLDVPEMHQNTQSVLHAIGLTDHGVRHLGTMLMAVLDRQEKLYKKISDIAVKSPLPKIEDLGKALWTSNLQDFLLMMKSIWATFYLAASDLVLWFFNCCVLFWRFQFCVFRLIVHWPPRII